MLRPDQARDSAHSGIPHELSFESINGYMPSSAVDTQTIGMIPEQAIATSVEIRTETPQSELVSDRHYEKRKAPKFTLRYATQDDIESIVDVDMKSFDSVYTAYDQSEEELRAELRDKFSRRLDIVGSEWMPVLERDGKIVGFMTCCPTSKTPEEFSSWEETTDSGTLESTYDPNGKNVYVVTLSVLPEGSQGKDMLYADQIGKMLSKGYEKGFFESRLPGLKKWMDNVKTPKVGKYADELSRDELETYANEYFNTKTTVKGKEVRKDRLIRLYERIGCTCLKVVPDAYQDEPSMNFGVICVYDGKSLFDGSDLPIKLPENKATRWAFGLLMQRVARSSKITGKLFS